MTDRSALHVAVVGAGISGLSAASLLSEAGIRCKVFEKNSRLGGLVSCTVEDGCLFHRVGGHVFNSKNKAVHDWFWAKFDRDHEFIAAKRKAAIWLNQAFVGYPIELSLDQLGKEKAKQVVQELIAIAGQGRPNLSELSFAGFLRANFGKTLCRTYFEPYNKKIWSGIDLDSVPLAWLDGKLPMIQPADIISKNILKSGDDMVHASFYYPARGGSQFIVDRIAANLDVIAEEVQSIEPEDGRLRINQHHTFSHVVFTGDVRRLIPMLGESWGKQTEQFNDAGVVNQLRSNGTTTMLCECDRNDYSWVYLPEEDVKCHRIIMTGNFSPANNRDGLASDRSTCTVEYSGHLEQASMEKELTKLPFNLKPIAYNYCDASYVVHGVNTPVIMADINQALKCANIFLCGRFAQWQYFNMDAAIESAMQVVNEIMQN